MSERKWKRGRRGMESGTSSVTAKTTKGEREPKVILIQ